MSKNEGPYWEELSRRARLLELDGPIEDVQRSGDLGDPDEPGDEQEEEVDFEEQSGSIEGVEP
jgi:hypothetical protein